jgi:hypothetical protein
MKTCSVHTSYQATCPECITAKRANSAPEEPVESAPATPAVHE